MVRLHYRPILARGGPAGIPTFAFFPAAGTKVAAAEASVPEEPGSTWVPDHGSLAEMDQRLAEAQEQAGSLPAGPTVRMSFNGRTSVFQTDDGSSILLVRSMRR